MNTSKLADIAEITSSIAILVTLVFLVVQMQQNTLAIQASTLQATLAQDLQHTYKVIDDPTLVRVGTNIELTEDEKIRGGLILLTFFRMREHDWLQYQNGNLNDESWETYSRPIPTLLSTQRARDWWRDAAPISFVASFVAEINTMIEDIPVNEQAVRALWLD